MLATLAEKGDKFNANSFINELFETSKLLGALEARVVEYKFNSILVPMFQNKEAISSMMIEGTQTTITDVFEDQINASKNSDNKVMKEYRNHTHALFYGVEHLRTNGFTDDFMKEIHRIMMTDILPQKKQSCIGKYKAQNNLIVNSMGKVVYTPPSHTETPKYMRELLSYMNNTSDSVNPLIKAAIIHSQFESIHPFEDGNGRVGRLLVSLYLYKSKVISFPFFYISEALCQDKPVYYNMLTESRKNSFDSWIKYFLQKCAVQANSLINYIDDINRLYERTVFRTRNILNTPKIDQIVECVFTQPVLTASYMAEQIGVTPVQANRYLNKLEEMQILRGDDRKRGRRYKFSELLDLASRK